MCGDIKLLCVVFYLPFLCSFLLAGRLMFCNTTEVQSCWKKRKVCRCEQNTTRPRFLITVTGITYKYSLQNILISRSFHWSKYFKNDLKKRKNETQSIWTSTEVFSVSVGALLLTEQFSVRINENTHLEKF